MPSSTHAPSSGTCPSSTNRKTSASRILVLSRWNMARRRSSGVIVGRPIALDTVPLREENVEAKGLKPVRKPEVEAPLSLREQWSRQVDQQARHLRRMASTNSENRTDHRA